MNIRNALFGLIMGLLLLAVTAVTVSAVCAPAIQGQLALAGTKTNIKTSGDLAFVAVNGNPGSLHIINVANPNNPQLLSTWTPAGISIFPAISTLRGLAVSGNYVYIGGQRSFYVLDISNPYSPVLVGELYAEDWEINSVAYDNGKVYLGYVRGSFQTWMSVVNVSNPAPVFMSTINLQSARQTWTSFVSNGVAYIGLDVGFRMVDVSDPSSPLLRGVIGSYNSWGDGTISGTTLYETHQYGITVWDTSNPEAPVNIGQITGFGTGPSLAVGQGNVLYQSTPSPYAFRVVDISSPNSPWPYRGALPGVFFERIAAPATGTKAYAVDATRFVVIDTTDCPSNSPPTASAGGPYSGDFGSAIGMSGASASDPDTGDTLTYEWTVNSASCSFDDASVLNPNLTCTGTGNFTATLEVSDGVNPPVSSDAAVMINKSATTTTVTCAAGPYTYTGAAQTPCSASVTGPGGLNLTPTPDYANNTNAGTANASYTYAESANHLGSNDSENFTIDKAGLNVTPDAQQILIGSPDPTFTFSYSGFVNSEGQGRRYCSDLWSYRSSHRCWQLHNYLFRGC
ncbi:MAG: hypothetical protein IPM25_11155 [Chloracidobacterium sp.]|nr:hypothetical protein [Chloracidobacterium sp.]